MLCDIFSQNGSPLTAWNNSALSDLTSHDLTLVCRIRSEVFAPNKMGFRHLGSECNNDEVIRRTLQKARASAVWQELSRERGKRHREGRAAAVPPPPANLAH